MASCKYYDCGFCYAPDDVETSATSQSACFESDYCPYLKSQMTDLDIIKECRQTGRTRTTTKKLLEKAYDEQMTEIEKVKAEIKVLEKKLSFLEELEKTKTPVEEAFKRIYNVYPSSSEKSVFWTDTDEDTWIAFQAGYNAAYEEKVAQEPEEEPEELKTLHQMFYEKKWNNLSCDEFCDVVKEWISQF